MPEKKNFNYKARMSDGRFVEGSIKADSEESVINDFIRRNIVLLEIKEESLLNKDIQLFKKGVSQKEIAQLMRQLATMTDAAIPLTRCLDVLKDQASNPTLKEVLGKVRADIEVGSTLANALAKHEKVFKPITVAMVKAGEAGGFLTPDVLLAIATNLEKEIHLRNKIKSALTYPGIVVILILLIVTALLIFVVPQFTANFANAGQALPLPTQILVAVSGILQGPSIVFPIALVVAGIYFFKKYQWKPEFRRVWEPIKFRIPVFGKLQKKTIIARFSRNFSSLLDAGLPIMQILEVVGATSASILIEDALKDVRKYVSVGELISPQLKKHTIFPQLLVEMLSVGEESGEMPAILLKIAESYDYEVEAMSDALSSLLEPLLVAFMGVVVGGILIALYLPMFEQYNFVGV
jgi:type IV pilus assembly protein PilC